MSFWCCFHSNFIFLLRFFTNFIECFSPPFYVSVCRKRFDVRIHTIALPLIFMEHNFKCDAMRFNANCPCVCVLLHVCERVYVCELVYLPARLVRCVANIVCAL